MKKAQSVQKGKGALELLEEVFYLLRLASTGTLVTYFFGSVPFVLGLLFFTSDMSRSPFAQERLAPGAIALSLLFLWMKVCQALFARHLWNQLQGHPPRRRTWSQRVQLTLTQLVLQPLGLFLLPFAFLILAPFGWTYAFFQNVTVFGGADDASVKTVFQKARQQALLWPGQNHLLLTLGHGFGFFVLINIISGFALGVYLLSSMFGIETPFSRSPWTYLNTTFFAVVLGLAYLCLDPLVKAAYVLRCFYGESLHSGEDLRADLRNLRAEKGLSLAAVLLALLIWSPTNTPAQENSPSPPPSSPAPSLQPAELDKSIEEVIRKTEYTWRFPREHTPKNEESKGFLGKFIEDSVKAIGSGIKAAFDWAEKVWKWITGGKNPNPTPNNFDWLSPINALLVVLLVLCAGLLIWLAIKIWKRYRAAEEQPRTAQAVAPMPDLNDENLAANQLPEDEWSRIARELLQRGEWRLALRALYLASLAHLASRNLVTITRSKSNQEYLRELDRRAHAVPEVSQLFSQNVSMFDRIWYGLHAVDQEIVEAFAGNVERIKTQA